MVEDKLHYSPHVRHQPFQSFQKRGQRTCHIDCYDGETTLHTAVEQTEQNEETKCEEKFVIDDSSRNRGVKKERFNTPTSYKDVLVKGKTRVTNE